MPSSGLQVISHFVVVESSRTAFRSGGNALVVLSAFFNRHPYSTGVTEN